METIRSEVKDGELVVTPETITSYTYDAAGRTLSVRRDIGAMTTTESTEYDAMGRVTKQIDVLGRETITEYNADGLLSTVTTPAGATFVTTSNPDGSTQSVSGTGQRAQQYSYDINGKNIATTVRLTNNAILSQDIINGFGQTVVQTQPNTLGGFIYTRSEYNSKGQMVKQYQDTGSGTTPTAPTLYEYDSFGNMVKQTLALSDTPTKNDSPVVEMTYAVESMEDGVYSVTIQTRYNAEGVALNTTQKQLMSQLSATMASKSISIDVRGNNSENWSVYSAPAKVTSYSSIPTSDITAESISIDGFTISQKDHVGISTTASRSYTATGMTMVQVDGRGNATTTETDLAKRTISVTDATGATTNAVYDITHNLPSIITDAMGNTSCYKYDHRGRKIAEWGTAIQPACFSYDDMDNVTALRTFRADGEVVTTDPTERSDYDETNWSFNDVTGLETSKTFADNTTVLKTYDDYNRLATETDARGNVKTHTYELARGLHLGTSYTVVDGTAATTARSFTYNHLGLIIQVTDDAGVLSIGYNTYDEKETDSLLVGNVTHLIRENRDSYGRNTGFSYMKNSSEQHAVTTNYGTDGRIASAGFLYNGSEKQFFYEYLVGSSLLRKLTMPNNMTLTQSYEEKRDLPTIMQYHRGNTLVTRRDYSYDILGCPISRNSARQGKVVNDFFTYNTRSELTASQVNGKTYEYNYDNIGNRLTTKEDDKSTVYNTNTLNQYLDITENNATTFVPEFDADGNQIRIKTETGIWEVAYNAENRPVAFSNSENNTVIECTYDSNGRRSSKKVMINGSVSINQRFIYRDYQQIAVCDMTRDNQPCIHFIIWDPARSMSSCPLAIRKDGSWFTYGWDNIKNVYEMFGPSGYIRTSYTYTPFGTVTENGDLEQNIRWNSEYYDMELGLYYYNYRFYNPACGNWLGRDMGVDKEKNSLYSFVDNKPTYLYDYLGLFAPGYGMHQADIESIQRTQHTMHEMTETKPTLGESLIPVIGSLHESLYAFGQGNITEGTAYLLLSISDFTLISSIPKGLCKLSWKTGSHTWSATRKWYGKMYQLPKGTHVHHWLLHRNQGLGKYFPEWFINQPWNLRPVYATAEKTSAHIHLKIIHGKKSSIYSAMKTYYNYTVPEALRPVIRNVGYHTIDLTYRISNYLYTELFVDDETKIDINLEYENENCDE